MLTATLPCFQVRNCVLIVREKRAVQTVYENFRRQNIDKEQICVKSRLLGWFIFLILTDYC